MLRPYVIRQLVRKSAVFRARLTWPKVANLFALACAYLARRAVHNAVPAHLKVDIAPSCQLSCPVCPHGQPDAPDFKSPRLISEALFESVVDACAGRTMAMSLYNLGEPLLHPRLPELAAYADRAGINTYVTSNLSLPLKPGYIERLVDSGLRLIIVALDGVSAETFGRQRIGGRWDLVSRNLQAIADLKRRRNSPFPHVVIQFLMFDFNAHEHRDVAAFGKSVDASEVHFIKGQTKPWLTSHAPAKSWRPKRNRWRPQCAWPYFSAVVGSSGYVVPCCHFRMADSYSAATPVRSLGDLQTQTLSEVFTSEPYQTMRALVSRPRSAPVPCGAFCEGCKVLTD